MSPEYIEYIYNKYNLQNDNIIVVSDEIKWCTENLLFLHNDVIYSTGNALEDLYLISIAKKVICSGSTYSVLGCIINNNSDKKCIIHSPFSKSEKINNMNIVPPYFIKEPYLNNN